MPEMTALLTNEDDNECSCQIDMKKRIILGVVCGAIGMLFSFLSFFLFVKKNYGGFAVLYTIGTIGAVASSFFIAGPKKHIKKLKDKDHLISAICLVASIVLVFIFALGVKSAGLAIVMVILELVALAFYYITLTTFGMKGVQLFCKKICNCNDSN